MKTTTRREILGSAGLAAGLGLLAGCAEVLRAASPQEPQAPAQQPLQNALQAATQPSPWSYRTVTPSAVAEEAYRLYPEGGCMYGVFGGILKVLAKQHQGPFESFPFHMLRYGAGGVGHWGSLCGTLNGGAAVLGLFEQDKQRCENLISQLFTWYETAELPTYSPEAENDSLAIPKSSSGSVLCHVSVGKWCEVSGDAADAPERKERCGRLTADVAVKVVELLNANLCEPCKFSGLSAEVQSCTSCHGRELHDTVGKMRCNSCHQQLSSKHPTVPNRPMAMRRDGADQSR